MGKKESRAKPLFSASSSWLARSRSVGQRGVIVGRFILLAEFGFLRQFAHAIRDPLRNGLRTREHGVACHKRIGLARDAKSRLFGVVRLFLVHRSDTQD